jgi:hypothetical protein
MRSTFILLFEGDTLNSSECFQGFGRIAHITANVARLISIHIDNKYCKHINILKPT